MINRFVIAITGPAGSGKTTVASILAKKIERCVNIDVDNVKHFIVNGFIYDDSPDGIKQWELLGKNIGQIAKNFIDEGYNVIINGYLNQPAWNNITKFVQPTHKFLLLPDLDVVMIRDKQRSVDLVMGRDVVATHYNYFSNTPYVHDFTKVDSSSQNIDQTVAEILGLLK
jgi:2-phosphoglycerate kinase